MNYKQDYEIIIKADNNDSTYWYCNRKGIPYGYLHIEDYQTIIKMLDDVRSKVYNIINEINLMDNSD